MIPTRTATSTAPTCSLSAIRRCPRTCRPPRKTGPLHRPTSPTTTRRGRGRREVASRPRTTSPPGGKPSPAGRCLTGRSSSSGWPVSNRPTRPTRQQPATAGGWRSLARCTVTPASCPGTTRSWGRTRRTTSPSSSGRISRQASTGTTRRPPSPGASSIRCTPGRGSQRPGVRRPTIGSPATSLVGDREAPNEPKAGNGMVCR
ncbi:conserved hypothetical protein [Mycobacterium marinum E11]|nr:conserved hypothetical protein [Mycobacterium marinum E11]